MNIKKLMLKTALLSTVVFTFLSCDNDFETIGSDIIGDPGYNTDIYDDALVSVTNNNLGPVQTNNLPVNLLGVYTDPFYGMQTANILTQVNISIVNPDFGTDPVLDSVVLSIPYFNTELEAEEGDEPGEKRYALDSIYGSSPIKLSIIESNLFLNDFDPETEFEESQKYFSDMQPQAEGNLGPVLYHSESFVPSSETHTVYGKNAEGDDDTLSLPPQMRIKLPVEYFQEKIIAKEGSGVFSSKNNFRNYFRGLYFKTEAINGKGNLMILDLEQIEAGITLYYTSQVQDTADEDEDENTEEMVGVQRSFKLNFGIPGSQGVAPQPVTRVNLFEQEVSYPNDENIYLKGGEGSMAVLELFDGPDANDDGISDELEFLRANDWLVNEANLTFYVNQDLRQGSNEPKHIYLYDLENNRMLADYILDEQGQTNRMSSTSNYSHLGPLEKNDSGEGIYYKIKLTRHVQNVINNDSTNVKLGLVVSQNINLISSSAVKNSEIPEVEMIPKASVISPEGTILYGPHAENEEKQLKLRIYYTEPKE